MQTLEGDDQRGQVLRSRRQIRSEFREAPVFSRAVVLEISPGYLQIVGIDR